MVRFLLLLGCLGGMPATDPPDLVPLPVVFPEHDRRIFFGCGNQRLHAIHLDSLDRWLGEQSPHPPIQVPRGTANLALRRPVTASDLDPVIGELAMITDGDKTASGSTFVELGPGRQWVQIDLGRPATIHAIALWHMHEVLGVYQAVVVQVADDDDFTRNVRTLFNNDADDLNRLGKGSDPLYPETNWGNLIPAKGAKARFVRCWSHGNRWNAFSHYTEVEVWGIADPGT